MPNITELLADPFDQLVIEGSWTRDPGATSSVLNGCGGKIMPVSHCVPLCWAAGGGGTVYKYNI